MPSKGLSVYSYISDALPPQKYTVEFSVPGPNNVITNTSADNFTVKALEMESSNIEGLRNFTGRFEWRVVKNEDSDMTVIASAYNNINTFTGNLAGGTMTSTQHFAPIVTDEVIITFGFYDAGHGEAGLTNRDQCYVTICPKSNSDWMGTIAPPGSEEASKPFSRFVLPAPHDNGMNTMQNADAVLQTTDVDQVQGLRSQIKYLNFFEEIPDAVLLHMLPNIVYGVSITQKKPIPTMLELGARYFEFRPAKLLNIFKDVSKLRDTFYFQHACIPGMAFDEFLEDQVTFLDSHPGEIVTIHIRYDNIVSGCEKPTENEIHSMFDDACSKATNAPLTWGGRECFSMPIDELRQSGKRIILVILAEKYDSWTAAAYATLHTESIIGRFESMDTEGQQSTDLTILQCQATSQSIKEVLVYSVVASNAATSCLSSTKAMGDMRTQPWLRKNVNQRLQAERTIVVMNDFIDGGTCETCIELSKERLAE